MKQFAIPVHTSFSYIFTIITNQNRNVTDMQTKATEKVHNYLSDFTVF